MMKGGWHCLKKDGSRRYKGRFFEEKAVEFLQQNGVRILERNYRVRQAEIDVVAETVPSDTAGLSKFSAGEKESSAPGTTLLFIEIKARTGKGSGAAAEAVTEAKQERICRCADSYLNLHGIDPYRQAIRFDVVTIETAVNRMSASLGRENREAAENGTDRENSSVMEGVGAGIIWIQDAFPYRAKFGRHRKPHWRVW